jgi:RHS repeat-associated protein
MSGGCGRWTIGRSWRRCAGATTGRSTYFRRYVGYDSLGRIRERISSNDAYGGRSFKYTPSGQLNEYARYSSLTASPCPFDANFGSNCISRFDPTTANEKDVYSFDDALNRRFDTNSGRTASGSTWSATTEFTYGTGDRIATSADFSFERDLDGNVTRRYDTTGTDVHYAWDEQGRLISATVPGPGPGIGNVVMYEYNAFGQLVRRRTYGLTDRYFLWNGDDLLAELDGSATSRIAEYVYWSTDQPMAIVTGASGIENIDYFLQDQLGNVRTAFRRASNASTTFSSDYSSWGLARDDTLAASSPNRLRWKGMFWEGGWTQLYYARNRWYSPQFGGFMSEDPLGPAGGANTYAFADNDPINGADPYGLHWIGGGIVEQFRLFSPIRPSRPSPPPTAASTGPITYSDPVWVNGL